MLPCISFESSETERHSKLLASLPHGGGLLYLGFALFHANGAVRDLAVTLFNQLRAYQVSTAIIVWNATKKCLGRSTLSSRAQPIPTICICETCTCERSRRQERSPAWRPWPLRRESDSTTRSRARTFLLRDKPYQWWILKFYLEAEGPGR